MAWNQSDQSREAAQELIQSIIRIERELASLQAQQSNDNDRYQSLRQDVRSANDAIRQIELAAQDYSKLLERVQLLEVVLSGLGKDLQAQFVTQTDFLDYQKDLEDKAEHLKYSLALAESKKIKATRKQWGFIAGGFIAAGIPFLHNIWDLLAWLIERIIN